MTQTSHSTSVSTSVQWEFLPYSPSGLPISLLLPSLLIYNHNDLFLSVVMEIRWDERFERN